MLVAGSEKAAAHQLGLSHSTVKHHLASARSKVGAETTAQLVWILGPRLPEPEGIVELGEQRSTCWDGTLEGSREVTLADRSIIYRDEHMQQSLRTRNRTVSRLTGRQILAGVLVLALAYIAWAGVMSLGLSAFE